MMESVAVVKRRGRDFWPCTPGFGGPVCRVGGKLHRAMPLLGKQTGWWEPCIQYVWVELGAIVVPAHCYPQDEWILRPHGSEF